MSALLIKPITNASTAIYVSGGDEYFSPDAHLFTSLSGTIQIEAEQITYTSYYMGQFNVAVRGANGTTATVHSAGVAVVPISSGGATTLQADANLSIDGAITLASGTNVTLDQTGNTITINSTGGGGVTYPLLADNGSVGAPSFSFASSPSTGMFSSGSNVVSIAAGGFDMADFVNGAYIAFSYPLLVQDSSIGAPAYTFAQNQSCGMYQGSAASLDFVCSSPMTFNTGGVFSGTFDDNADAGNTRFLLYDNDSGMTQRVSVGAPNSGGTGFKVLRIPN